MAAPRWRGSKDLTQGKVHYEAIVGKSIVTTSFEGPYAVCVSRQPKPGSSIAGIAAGHKITRVNVIELDGDAGRIEVTLEKPLSEEELDDEPIGEPTFEIEWIELQRPIEMHPNCGTLKAGRYKWNGGVKQGDADNTTKGDLHTWDDWAELDADDYQAGGADSSWSLAQYKSLKAKGVDSYVLAQPILRRTLIYLKPPEGIGAATGKRTTPPKDFTPGGWQWLGGPDRCVKQGRTFTRSTEWRGAEVWSPLIYPMA